MFREIAEGCVGLRGIARDWEGFRKIPVDLDGFRWISEDLDGLCGVSLVGRGNCARLWRIGKFHEKGRYGDENGDKRLW